LNHEVEELEKEVSAFKLNRKRSYTSLAVIAILMGVGLIGMGSYLSKKGVISASSENPPQPPLPVTATPPVPPQPTSTVTPPVPPEPNEIVFPSGWSMISGLALANYDMKQFKDAGLMLFSFNDPKLANRDWAILSKDNSANNPVTPRVPLGYYVYNPGTDQVTVNFSSGTPPSDTSLIFARGWHLMYWAGDAATKDQLLSSINLTYSDGSTLSAAKAVDSDQHKASLKIYVVVNEHDLSSASIKELTDSNSETTISKIPKNSFFWFYLRRTKYRVAKIDLSGQTITVADAEKAKIDAWLKANNLTDCGDAAGTMYPGGSCLFDEATGKTKDKYELLVKKFPDKPWNK